MSRADMQCLDQPCNDRVWAKGRCARHYEKDKYRKHPRHRTDQLLKNRIRGRAVARLVEEYKERFEQLKAEETIKVMAEAKALQESTGGDPNFIKLQPGKRPASEPEAVDRVRLDVAECPRCIGYHDRGHKCPDCGKPPQQGIGNPRVTAGMTEVERLLRSGKTPYQVADLTGMPLAHCRNEFIRLREAR